LFLTLIIVPVIYAIFDHWIERRKNRKQQKTIEELMEEEYVPAASEDGFTPVHVV
jgi:HAE1 family hydrophobic/amphiphilic exporter-1